MQNYKRYRNTNSDSELERAKYIEEFTNLLHFMFCSDQWEKEYGYQKRLRVSSYCLLYGGITVAQLLSSGLSVRSVANTELYFLRYLCHDKIFTYSPVTVGADTTNVYHLTPEGALWCKDTLLDLCESKPLPVSKECVTYVYKNFKKYNRAFSSHSLSIWDMCAYFLSLFKNTDFSYTTERHVCSNGELMSATDMAAMTGNINRTDVAFVADALLEYPILDNTVNYRIFIEQDMSTQRRNVLSLKLNNYTNYLLANSSTPEYNALVFSLQTHRVYDSKQGAVSKNNSDTVSADAYLAAPITLLAYQLHKLEYPYKPASTLIGPIDDCIADCGLSKGRIVTMRNYISSFIEREGDLSIQRLLDDISSNIAIKNGRNLTAPAKNQFDSYKNRRSVIFELVQDNDELTRCIMTGFTVATVHNKNLNGIFPFIFPHISTNVTTGLNKVSHNYFDTPFNCAFDYEPVYTPSISYGLSLRNHFIFDGSTHVFVENISDDVGGFVRVKNYLDNVRWEGVNGALICFVEDFKTINEEFSFIFDTNYCKTLFSGSTVPLKLYLLSYRDCISGIGLVEPSSEGKFINSTVLSW